MPTTIMVQAALPAITGLPRDNVVNTFHFVVDAADEPTGAAILDAIEAFYDPLSDLYSTSVRFLDGVNVAMYDLDDPEPRLPFFESSFTLSPTPASAINLPNEVAVCLSYRAEYSSGGGNGRRRGRIFLGPFNAEVLGTSTSNPPTIDEGTITAIGVAVEALVTALPSGAAWAVFSRAGSQSHLLTEWWVDNEWDTQRRRGRRATSRVVVGTL